MSRNIWIGIVVVVVLFAGGWWYLNQSSAPATPATTELPTVQQNQQPTSQPTANKPKPSATVDKLAPADHMPEFIVTGTAANTDSVSISVRAITPAKATGYTGLFTQENVPAVNGHWSVTISAYAFSGFSPPYNVLVETSVSGKREMLANKDLVLTLPPTITANVLAGNAPLTVQFSVAYMGLGDHWVEFGDGQQENITCSAYKPETDACTTYNDKVSHTYTQPGTYAAKYMEGNRGANGMTADVTGSVTITVR